MLFFQIAKYFYKKMCFLCLFFEEHCFFADERLNVSNILPLVKVSWKQGFKLVNELRFTAYPLDKWFRFHRSTN